MKNLSASDLRIVGLVCALLVTASSPASAQDLTNGLVAYWPLDQVQGNKTPDLVNGYDMQLNNLSAADLVEGIRGKCFSFSNQKKTLLSRVHGANDELPINKQAAFTVSLWTKVNGTGQSDLRVFSEGNTSNSDPLFNIGTSSTGGNGSVDLFLRQSGLEPGNHILTTGEPFDDQWHHLVFVQQEDGSRTIYIDGVADELEIAAKPAGSWKVNDTTIGGILRAAPTHWVSGLIDEVALWKRALTAEEINSVKTNGVPNVGTSPLPLEIKKFAADFPSVTQGDKVVLHWEASKDASLSIGPGVGDVSAQTQFGVGSLELAVNQTTSFTLTATRGTETLTAQTIVHAVSGVQPNWRLIENFEFLPAGGIAGQGNWLNPEGLFSVVDLGANKALGFTGGANLAAVPLNSLSLSEGRKATLFFRVSVLPDDTASAIGVNLGLTERPIRFNGDFTGNVGPFIRLERLADGGTIDAQAHNGVGAAFDAVADALQPGVVYQVWIDVENRGFDVGDLYSVYLAKEGASRATLFQDYVADRDAVNIDPALGTPGLDLNYLFFSAIDANQGTNTVLFDDFYLSSNGFNTSTPVSSSSFQPPPTQIVITGFAYSAGAKSFTVTWTTEAGRT
ncbi:MAG: LamG domain-containing protein, partial [Verrucomicrobiota bacterium]